MKVVSKSIEETSNFAKELIKIAKEKSNIISLQGDLGAGKTALTKCIAKHLGVVEEIKSPTFVLRQDYETKDEEFNHLVHIDAYRFNKEEEVISIGWEDISKMDKALIVIEWGDIIKNFLPKNTLKVLAKVEGDTYEYKIL